MRMWSLSFFDQRSTIYRPGDRSRTELITHSVKRCCTKPTISLYIPETIYLVSESAAAATAKGTRSRGAARRVRGSRRRGGPGDSRAARPGWTEGKPCRGLAPRNGDQPQHRPRPPPTAAGPQQGLPQREPAPRPPPTARRPPRHPPPRPQQVRPGPPRRRGSSSPRPRCSPRPALPAARRPGPAGARRGSRPPRLLPAAPAAAASARQSAETSGGGAARMRRERPEGASERPRSPPPPGIAVTGPPPGEHDGKFLGTGGQRQIWTWSRGDTRPGGAGAAAPGTAAGGGLSPGSRRDRARL